MNWLEKRQEMVDALKGELLICYECANPVSRYQICVTCCRPVCSRCWDRYSLHHAHCITRADGTALIINAEGNLE